MHHCVHPSMYIFTSKKRGYIKIAYFFSISLLASNSKLSACTRKHSSSNSDFNITNSTEMYTTYMRLAMRFLIGNKMYLTISSPFLYGTHFYGNFLSF